MNCAQAVAEALRGTTTLQTLDLVHNSIGPQG